MDIKPIRTNTDYRAALKEIGILMMAAPDTPKGEKLDMPVDSRFITDVQF